MPVIKEFNPDIIVTTHPFNAEMISNLRESKKIDIPHLCILTDYAPHLTWINKNVDSYVVASNDMVELMVKMGVDKNIVHPFGIPVDMAFYSYHDKESIMSNINFDPKLPTILIMAGSFGVNDILNIYDNIVEIDYDFQIIVITGRNQRLYKAFDKRLYPQDKKKKIKFKIPSNVKKLIPKIKSLKKTKLKKFKKPSLKKFRHSKPTELIYFTTEVEKYMKISDLIITKPGGLTVSEALACNLPMAIFDAIPGQEEENAEFLIKNNMAIQLGKDFSSKESITALLKDSKQLIKMKEACISFDKSDSKENILKEIIRLVNEKNNSSI